MCQIKPFSLFINPTLITVVPASIELAISSHRERLVHFCRLIRFVEKKKIIMLGFDSNLGYVVLLKEKYIGEYFHN